MEKLFNLRNESLSNQPTDEEISFISTFLENEFSEIENIDLKTRTDEERQLLFGKINSIKNAIADLLSPDGGNYHKLLIELNTKLNFESRLSKIIKKLWIQNSEAKKYQTRNAYGSINVVHNTSYGYQTFELNEYLNKLILIPALTNEEVESQLNKNREIEIIFKYLSDFLNHLLFKYAGRQMNAHNQFETFPIVFFLRDTLLLYLGAKQLQAKGVLIDAKAILINRKLIHSFLSSEENNSIYKKSYNLIFQVLSAYQGMFSRKFMTQYKELFTDKMTKPEIQLIKFIQGYLNEILGTKNNFVGVDSAAHGTMPLLTHAATGRLNSLEMFTSTPWLYKFYSSNIFASNFPNMRSLESLVCQEELFQFAYISERKIYIKETCDPLILSKAKIEIGIFLNILNKYIPIN